MREMDGLTHWDCWGSCGMRHADTPTTNTTPEAAMERLLEHCRLIYGEQDWSGVERGGAGVRDPRAAHHPLRL
jgi:hypothetical protein